MTLMQRRRALMGAQKSGTDGRWVNDTIVLSEADFVVGGVGTAYPYIFSGTTRVSYLGLDVNVSNEYSYSVFVVSTKENPRFGIRSLSETNYNQVINHETTSPVPGDSGWKTGTYTFTPSSTIVNLWFTMSTANNAKVNTSDFTLTITREKVA